ncbi:PREDICTED: DNA polymerase beta-like isoform X2 [Dufourea novaeangliae]|uniref:DNA polymerase n=1 Tax=Dufourea novaeangliae TaxID=178035 RepID=A0A154P7H5_DUFNO|nr:PREDICTED: DNA polymerase beta-like isoform X2 [Dufourea novaeangliae]KZC07070.1 DNA polymerase beta [Dufourea novaeangliae]
MGKRKASGIAGNPNQDLCDFLMELADYERNVSKNIYKYNAYRKAASSLSGLSHRVINGDAARKLPGIGEKIAKKIDEFLNTGKLQKLEDINKDETNVAINLLTRVSGIGPAKAKELVEAGIKTLDDLRKQQDKLNRHQKIGLEYFEDFKERIPREEIEQIEKIMKDHIMELSSEYIITICGSYRRGKEESGDIDVLLTHPLYTSKEKESKKKVSVLKNVVECLEKKRLIVDTISLGPTKFMGVCQLPNSCKPCRRLDIRLAPYDQYYCAALYFTGSDLFNKNMRARALEKKYTLNEYTLKRLTPEGVPREPEKISSEEDIFRFLEMSYKEPKDRNA